MKKTLIITIVILLVQTNCFANRNESKKALYLTFATGTIDQLGEPSTTKFGPKDELEFKTGWQLATGLGYYISKEFRLEGLLSYSNNDVQSASSSNVKYSNVDGEQTQTQISLSSFYHPFNLQYLSPYIGFGFGYSKVSYNDITINNFKVIDDDDMAFSYHLSIGSLYKINDTFSLDAYIKYMQQEDLDIENVNGINVDLANEPFVSVTIGLQYKF